MILLYFSCFVFYSRSTLMSLSFVYIFQICVNETESTTLVSRHVRVSDVVSYEVVKIVMLT